MVCTEFCQRRLCSDLLSERLDILCPLWTRRTDEQLPDAFWKLKVVWRQILKEKGLQLFGIPCPTLNPQKSWLAWAGMITPQNHSCKVPQNSFFFLLHASISDRASEPRFKTSDLWSFHFYQLRELDYISFSFSGCTSETWTWNGKQVHSAKIMWCLPRSSLSVERKWQSPRK